MSSSLLSWFLRIGIQGRLTLIFILLSTIPITVLGLLFVNQQIEIRHEENIRNMDSEIKGLQASTQLFLIRVESEINLVMKSTEMKKVLDVMNGTHSVDENLLTNANKEFLNLFTASDYYIKGSLMTARGKEIIVVVNDSQEPEVLLKESMSKIPKNYYRNVVQNMKRGEIFLSPAETKKPSSEELLPIIDFIMPIHDSENRIVAIVSINISTEKFFELLLPSFNIPTKKIFIVNEEGYYIFHSEKKNTWNELFTNKSDENIHNEYSPEIVADIFAGEPNKTLYDRERIIKYSPIFSGNKTVNSKYYIVEDVAEAEVMGSMKNLNILLFSIILFVGLTSIVLAYLTAQLFLKPIQQLVKGTQIIRAGNLDYKLQIKSTHEIHDLIQNFNDLVLEWKNKQLLQKENRKLSESVEQSPIAIIITDPDFMVEYVNPKAIKLNSYWGDALKASKVSLFAHGLLAKDFNDEDMKTLKASGAWKKETQTRTAEGRLIWEFVTISAIKDESDVITNFLVMKEDITQRKEMVQELIVAKEKAESVGRLKSEFLHQMSHEIRTPLNIINGVASIIEEELLAIDDPQLNTFLDSLKSASARIIRTIETILMFSELRSGTYVAKFAKIDVQKTLVPFIKKEAEKYAKNPNIMFRLRLPEGNCSISADEYSLQQILVHLLDNAFKYTKKGSVTAEFSKEQGSVIIKISDTGIGMTKEFLREIFNPFTQEDQSLNRPFEGNGLGLALIKEFCALNNIKLSVESEKHTGSTFTLVLSACA